MTTPHHYGINTASSVPGRGPNTAVEVVGISPGDRIASVTDLHSGDELSAFASIVGPGKIRIEKDTSATYLDVSWVRVR